ncbi:MAG: TDP-N-acetylfucosamine:lipid II N-acetylfucosaminyltransferase [Flavobacterium sp. JAD_PAG50586_2]|nr:MAG: TDP-N-acetylfucosamine:lipid II N-acetylfucosaminyltransferase [Flavobacterium sp. JAD_PAG50586_2]
MILHLVHDEKIINRTIDIFETVTPGDNLYVVFTRHKPKFVKQHKSVITFKEYESYNGIKTFSSVIVHYLNSRKIRFVQKHIKNHIPIYWIIWGNDLYNKLLYPKGFELWDKESSYYKKKNFAGKLAEKIISRIKTRKIESFVSKRISAIATDTTEIDYDMLINYYPKLNNIPWMDFFYYPIEMILEQEMMQKWVDGNNIQIGNSGSTTNNHEYAMRFLSKLELQDRKIMVPLSYSGTKDYKETVKKAGKISFGDNFIPLDTFLPLQEYNQLMISFGVAIYGNWRQEAIGNILISLYLGAKIFLPSVNPVMQWAKHHKLAVFELESISQYEIDTPLDEASRIHNREILLQLYNLDRLKSLITSNFIKDTAVVPAL